MKAFFEITSISTRFLFSSWLILDFINLLYSIRNNSKHKTPAVSTRLLE
ncbi:putative protein 433R [Cricket iridovirus]|uniref:433R n=2 Tax=Iridovirus TaxID=10487 RepID=Q91F92_IIV6|nr:433R [Invertebrate iridescent virus 6]AAK82293.1 433R [Invertebrate iridescent virus 6]QMS79432.1 hypothetical protein IIV6-T1_425 [Invertebrate iridescent virus 6]QNH08843.1 433R [Invertebrate iridescent virus Kaz2018]UIB20674.1 putative protein 433R [Cricket iridovirus]